MKVSELTGKSRHPMNVYERHYLWLLIGCVIAAAFVVA